MTTMRFLFLISLLGFSLVQQGAKAAEKPNIIVIFIDDMGYSDFSCFGGKVRTQHVDQLAAEGIKFTNFYVNSPICSPSRVALTTGQYPQRWRITSYLNNRRDNKRRGMAQWLDPRAPTLARQLKAHGYATGHFGKWHMGGQRDVDDAPPITDYGFDQSLTNFEGMGPKLLPLTKKPNPDGGDPIVGRIWAKAERLGDGFQWKQRSEITTGFVDAALTFIDQSADAEKPFFINLWPDDVHGPFWPPLDKWGGDKRALYQGVLDSMDEQFARLFDRVRNDPKLRDNTIITVCSDNGHEPGAGTSKPFRGAKTWMYEGGIRSPLIVWAPGLIEASHVGTTNDESVFCALDLNRSLYQLADIEPAEALDGEVLTSTLLGQSKASRQAPIFWRRPPDRPGYRDGMDEDNPDLAARDEKWKYLVNHDGSDPQLYDLPADPSETTNLATANPEIVAGLDRALRAWNAALPMDRSHPDYTNHQALAGAYELVIVAGQSNAVGFDAKPGKLSVDPLDENVLFWWRTGDPPPDQHDSIGGDLWQTLRPQPLGKPAPKNSAPRQYGNFAQAEGGFGPEIGFARTLLRHDPERKLAILKVAFSGTSISGDWDPDKRTEKRSCYAALLNEFTKAQAKAKADNISLKPCALIWVQGESDASPANTPHYAKHLADLIAALRKDLAAPELHAMIAVNTRFQEGKNPHMPAIVEAQKAMAAADTLATYIDTATAPIANGAHFDTRGTLLVGQWFGEAYLKANKDQ